MLCAFWPRHVLRGITAWTFSTSQLKKRVPNMSWVQQFDLETCFAPQRRALFRLPTVIRPRCALCFVISRCASRHSGVQLVISHLPRCLRTRRISEPTCRPSGATNHWIKKIVRCDFPTFSRTWISFLLALSLLWSSLFCSSLLWLFPPLIFLFSVHLAGSLTSNCFLWMT